MNSQTSSSRSGSRLENDSVLSFDQTIGDQILKQGQKFPDVLFSVDELDAKRHVLDTVNSSLLRMDAMMRPEPRFRAHNSRTGYAVFEKQSQDLAAQVVATGTRVLI